MPKYLCLQRTIPTSEVDAKPSPADMQGMYARFNQWREQFAAHLIDAGGKLGSGKLVTAPSVEDGPLVEVKELVGGYMIVSQPGRRCCGGTSLSWPCPPWLRRRGHRDRYALTPPALVEHFFRHEYGRLVAMLARRLGMHQLEAIEDSVQAALLAGLESWGRHGIPDNPSAWLFRVATNEFLGDARKQNRRLRLDERVAALGEPQLAPPLHPSLRADVPDDLLRMLVYCCDEALPLQTQIVLALKTLCGFDVREIACRLFTSEANVYKPLGQSARAPETGPTPGGQRRAALAA